MARGILFRLAHALLSLLVLLLLVFLLVRLSGDPTYSISQPDAPPALAERLREEWGLNEPLPQQFVAYLANLAQGNLGQSFRSRVPVSEMIMLRLPATIVMGAGALVLTLIIGLPL